MEMWLLLLAFEEGVLSMCVLDTEWLDSMLEDEVFFSIPTIFGLEFVTGTTLSAPFEL